MKAMDVKTSVTAGSLIKKLRKEKGLTQAELSRRGEKNEICSERHLRRIENGDAEPTPFMLNKMLKVLGVSAPEFAQMLDDDESVTEFFYEFSSILNLALDARYDEAGILFEKLKNNDKYNKSNPKIAQTILMYEAGVLRYKNGECQRSAEMFRKALCLTVPTVMPKKGSGYLNYKTIADHTFSWAEYRILLLMVNTQCELGHLDEALSICNAIMTSMNRKETDGEIRSRLRPIIYQNLSEIYLKKELYDEALEVSSLGITEYKYVVIERLLNSKAKALFGLNNIEGAKAAFQQAYDILRSQQREILATRLKSQVAKQYQIEIT